MNLMELKDALEPEDIKRVLLEYGISPIQQTEEFLVYPTVCHNLSAGSPKLYYYYNTRLFVCYTECNDSFNIFQLIQKMEKLQGYDKTIFEIAENIGFGNAEDRSRTEEEIREEQNLTFLTSLSRRTEAPLVSYESVDESILENFLYDNKYTGVWLEEGMTEEALRVFEIGFSIKDEAISIPHRDKNGKLIGVRGRFLSPNAPNKYMPLSLSGKLLTHAIRGNLYGLHLNKANIERLGKVIIFESEKSVILFGSLFGQDNNIAVATCGNRITNEQIRLLTDLNIEEVVLAFDQDFTDEASFQSLIERYDKIGKRLAIYFNTSVLIDWEGDVDYKDSPLDKGDDIFNKIYSMRYYI